ncbi:hypothetical protein FQR65_LT01528 [Abscondita terminalis]|nr:hypothetical protein FQR65_LT01528 [Abscondita terminalis]
MGIVLHVNSVEGFYTDAIRFLFDSQLFYPNANPNVKWLIITSKQEFSKFFLQSWQAEIMHVAILVYNSNQNDTSLRLYTANPQDTLNDCGKVVNMINEQNCKSEFTFEFPPVLRKYTNCSIILEFTVYEVVSDKYGAFLKAQFFSDLIISRLNSSSTATDNDKKFFIDFRLIRMPNHYESSSSIIYSGMALWLVPKPRPMSTLKVITVIFQKILWICILFSFFVISMVWWIILKLKNKGVDSEYGFTLILLDMWGATLFGSIYKMPTFRALRFLAISYIVYCIHIQALFSSKLLQSLTVLQYERGINNFNDVSHSSLQVFASLQLAYAIFFDFKNDSVYNHIYNSLKWITSSYDLHQCIKEHQCVAVLTGQEHYLNAELLEVSDWFQDNTFTGTFYYTFHSLKWSYFTATLEKLIYMFFESGITNDFGQRSIIDDSKTVESRQIFHQNLNPNMKWLVITSSKEFSKFFLLFWEALIMHVVVLVYNSNENCTRLYTGNPQEMLNRCGKVVSVIREQNCKSKFIFEFPPVLRKYTNCSIILEANDEVINDKHESYIKSKFLANLIISRLNSFSTATNNGIKFFMDFRLIRIPSHYQSSNFLIYSGTAIWFVPKPRQMSTLKVITVIFQKILWICILFSFFVMSLLWWIILKLKNKGVDSENRFTLIMLDMWGATLFGSVYKLPTIRALRFLVISYILYCIHIQTLFSSKLLQSLTVPQYERGIKNVEDVFHSNLQVFASSQLRGIIDVSYKNDRIYNQRYQSLKYMLPNADLCDCIKKYQCAAIVTGHEYFLKAAFFEVSNTFTDTTFTGNWYYAFHSLKWSYFTTTLEKITYILFESGITNDFGKRSMIDDSKTVVESKQVVLTVNHVYIVFVFLLTSLVLSLFVFFMELFVNNYIGFKRLGRHVRK